MKKIIALTIIFCTMFALVGCVTKVEAPTPEPETESYTAYGRYYTNGTVITEDGNEWSYSTDTISDRVPYDAMPVWIGMDDNGTPDNITDDVVLGLVYDLNTAVYDKLEKALSEEFETKRDKNNITIGGIK